MTTTRAQWAGLFAGVVAGIALFAALASEWWGGLVPCALCLLERWPYRATILFGALALASPRGARLMVVLAAASMLASAVLGGIHVGVERGDWPSPLPECAAPNLGGGTAAERLARMPAHPAKPCDEPAYLLPELPLSMAGMNLGLSVVMTVALAAAAIRPRANTRTIR